MADRCAHTGLRSYGTLVLRCGDGELIQVESTQVIVQADSSQQFLVASAIIAASDLYGYHGEAVMLESLELQLANREIDLFVLGGPKQLQSGAQQDAAKCSNYLGQGIAALVWLERTEETLQKAAAVGIYEITAPVEELIESLYRAWLESQSFAEDWIQRCEAGGVTVSQAAAYRAACERAKEWLQRAATFSQARDIRNERFAQEAW